MTEEQIDRFYTDLGRRLQRARTGTGITQQALAKVAGLTRSSVANVEAGRQRVPIHVLAAMADALQVETANLFDAELLSMEAGRIVVTLPLLTGDAPNMRKFVEATLASVGIKTRWAA